MPKRRREKSDLARNLGSRIKERRSKLGLTQTDLAEKLGVESETISRIERGISTPSLPMLEEVAEALNSGIAELLSPASANINDQLMLISKALKPLSTEQRAFCIDSLHRQAQFLSKQK